MFLLLLLLIPLVGALLSFVIGRNEASAKSVAIASSLLSLGVFIYAAAQFTAGSTEIFSFAKPWIASAGLNFKFSADGISVLLLALTSVLVPLIVLSAADKGREKSNVFYALVLFTQFTLVGVFTAGDLFLFYFFFEAALVPVYFLIINWGGENAPKSAFKMFIYTIFGSLLMLAAMVFLYTKGQTADLEALKSTAALMPAKVQMLLFGAFIIAFAIKMPLFPFHTWQPNAYTDSPATATMLLSGLLSKMGVFGLIRIALPMAPLAANEYAMIVTLLAIVGLIYGSVIAIKQDDIKRLIAYSSFAHMGLMAAGVLSGSVEGIQGAVFQMLAHGVNAVGLFYVAKIIFERTGTRSLSQLGGISQQAPVLSVLFMIILLGSVALPLTNGFVGEFLMLKAVFEFDKLIGVIAGLSIILGAVYMLRLFQKTMFGEVKDSQLIIADVTGLERLVLVIISGIVLIMGVFPNVILKVSEPAAVTLLDYLSSI